MIKILAVDDHLYLIRGLISVFAEDDNIRIVASAESGIDALEKLKNNDIDIVLLDILMPEMDGVVCCRLIKKKYPHIKVIAFTGELNTQILFNIWNNKADGLLTKTCGIKELTSAISSVYNGQKIIGNNVQPFSDEIFEDNTILELTPKETEILKLLGTGLSRKEIAGQLFIEVGTVNFHCKNIRRKYGNKKTSTVIAEAKKSRLIT